MRHINPTLSPAQRELLDCMRKRIVEQRIQLRLLQRRYNANWDLLHKLLRERAEETRLPK